MREKRDPLTRKREGELMMKNLKTCFFYERRETITSRFDTCKFEINNTHTHSWLSTRICSLDPPHMEILSYIERPHK